MDTLISQYSNKEVLFRYDGTDLSFLLSQALFSSYEIDKGSRLLLKTLCSQIDFSTVKEVLDIGCGIGTLGIALQKRHPHVRAMLQDRDALAVAFSRYNAEKNRARGIKVVGGLAFQGLEEQHFDLIISNIPAKIGEPVLTDIYRSMLERAGLCAVVVVNPLSDFTQHTLSSLGADIIFREDSSGHSVFHFTAPPPLTSNISNKSNTRPQNVPDRKFHGQLYREAGDLPSIYFRDSHNFETSGLQYSLDTVWGLADFDTQPYQTLAASRCLAPIGPPQRICLWNPGQGHTAALLTAQHPESAFTVDLCSRDMLSLQVTRHNLLGKQQITLGHMLHSPSPVEAAEHYKQTSEQKQKGYSQLVDLFIVELEHLAGIPSPSEVFQAAEILLAQGGSILITGKSAHIHKFERPPKGYSAQASKKHKGFKAVMLKRV